MGIASLKCKPENAIVAAESMVCIEIKVIVRRLSNHESRFVAHLVADCVI